VNETGELDRPGEIGESGDAEARRALKAAWDRSRGYS
jgi:hypothetical protein